MGLSAADHQENPKVPRHHQQFRKSSFVKLDIVHAILLYLVKNMIAKMRPEVKGMVAKMRSTY